MGDILKLNPGEVIGIGSVATVLSIIWAWVVYKVFQAHREDQKEVMDRFVRLGEHMTNAVQKQTEATKASNEIAEETKNMMISNKTTMEQIFLALINKSKQDGK